MRIFESFAGSSTLEDPPLFLSFGLKISFGISAARTGRLITNEMNEKSKLVFLLAFPEIAKDEDKRKS